MRGALKKGDAVSGSSSQGPVEGRVVKTLTTPIYIEGHPVAASKENPEVLVKCHRTGAAAAHKPGSLQKR